MIKEDQLLEQRELRDKLVNRVDVLEKVKELLLHTESATLNQVADFYEVDSETVKKAYQRNKDEIDMDGVVVKNYNYFLTGQKCTIKKLVGKSMVYYSNGDELTVPNRGINVFPRRAILRIGMLLRDSEIAKEIRNQLLNIEEKTSTEIKVQDLNEEQKLMLEIGMSVASGNTNALAIASANLVAFKNRHIEQLQQDNKALAGEILTWEDRSQINFAIRKLAATSHQQVGYVWNNLYKELKYKHHIDVKLRGDKPYIEHVKENEWSKVMKSFSAICEDNDISPSDILNNMKVSGGTK